MDNIFSYTRSLFRDRSKSVLVFYLTLTFPIIALAQTNQSTRWPGYDLNGESCVAKSQGKVLYDYGNPKDRGEMLSIVEKAHFTKSVESLTAGKSTSIIGADIDYTLKVFPNHHRALYAMARYQLPTPKHESNLYYSPAECYFQRALSFKPSDYRVYQLYSYFLKKKGRLKMAAGIYEKAIARENAPIEINYALGILYVDMKEYDKAVEQAKIVYGSGYKKTKLSRKLKKVKRWPLD